jgi:hypothetical protein
MRGAKNPLLPPRPALAHGGCWAAKLLPRSHEPGPPVLPPRRLPAAAAAGWLKSGCCCWEPAGVDSALLLEDHHVEVDESVYLRPRRHLLRTRARGRKHILKNSTPRE